MSTPTQSEALHLDELDATLETLLIGQPMPSGRKFLGIEVERLILHEETKETAPLDFCRTLLSKLADEIDGERFFDGEVMNRVDGEDFSFTMEPGGQLELATSPRSQLSDIDPTMTKIRELVDRHLEGSGYALSPLGHAPVTKVEDIGLLPRDRYRIMDEAMIKRGELSRHMMRATAGFQVTYDVCDRRDAGRKLALLNRLAPVILAVTANSRMVGGEDSGFESFRHYVWMNTDSDRVGVPPGGLHADSAIDGYKQFARRATMLFQKREGKIVASPAKTLEQVVASGTVTLEDLELHLTSLFPFVRLRNYLEVRYLDSCDWSLARSVLAMLSGLIYCPTATARAEELAQSLVPLDAQTLRELHIDAARHGLDAQDLEGTSFRSLAQSLLEFSAATIGGRDCRWAETGDLDMVSERLG